MVIEANLSSQIVSSNFSEAFSLHEKSSFGEPVDEKIQYTLSEAFYLVEKDKMDLFLKGVKIPKKDVLKRIEKIDNRIQVKYLVFKNLRDRGYIVKTALKFGADFRVYNKGSRPGNEHAKWIVFCEHESKKFSWHEFSAKNRVAHSTKKNLLLAIVDEEGDVSYYEVSWIKP